MKEKVKKITKFSLPLVASVLFCVGLYNINNDLYWMYHLSGAALMFIYWEYFKK